MLPGKLKHIVRLRVEVAERDRALYGDLLDDVTLLRRRGFAVHREEGRFRVGNKLTAARTLRAVAARERRLMGDAAWPASAASSPSSPSRKAWGR